MSGEGQQGAVKDKPRTLAHIGLGCKAAMHAGKAPPRRGKNAPNLFALAYLKIFRTFSPVCTPGLMSAGNGMVGCGGVGGRGEGVALRACVRRCLVE